MPIWVYLAIWNLPLMNPCDKRGLLHRKWKQLLNNQPKNVEDYYGLRYAEFTVPLVKAIQEQQLQIEAQQILIQQLLERMEALEK